MRTVHRALALALPTAVLAAARARPGLTQTPNIRVAGRIQAQFSAQDGDSSDRFNPSAAVGTAFDIRRLRIQADVRIGENITMVIQPSFEMSALRMRDAYLRALLWRSPTAGVALTMGQEKKPFNRHELTSSNTLLSIERGARFRGLGAAAVQNNLLEENGYIAHDLGASLDAYAGGGRYAVKAGVYNGSGESAADVNNAKTFAARATATVLQDAELRPVLRVGVAAISRDRGVTTTASSTRFAPDSAVRTAAWDLDLEWGDFRPGLHVIADFAQGRHLADTTFRYVTGRNAGLRPGAPDSAFSTFRSLHVVASWRFQFEDPAGTRLVKIIEPALRVDLTDPDVDRADDGGLLVSPVLNVHLSQTTVLRAGIDIYRYTDGAGTSRSLRAVRVSWQSNF
jgi:hypothetical protein